MTASTEPPVPSASSSTPPDTSTTDILRDPDAWAAPCFLVWSLRLCRAKTPPPRPGRRSIPMLPVQDSGSRRMPRESPDAPEDLPEEALCQVVLSIDDITPFSVTAGLVPGLGTARMKLPALWEEPARVCRRGQTGATGREGAVKHAARVGRAAAPCDEAVTSRRNSHSLFACRWLRASATSNDESLERGGDEPPFSFPRNYPGISVKRFEH